MDWQNVIVGLYNRVQQQLERGPLPVSVYDNYLTEVLTPSGLEDAHSEVSMWLYGALDMGMFGFAGKAYIDIPRDRNNKRIRREAAISRITRAARPDSTLGDLIVLFSVHLHVDAILARCEADFFLTNKHRNY